MRRILVLIAASLLLSTSVRAEPDCEALSGALDEVSGASAAQVGAMWGTASLTQGLPVIVVQSISSRVENPVALAGSGLDGGEIIKQTLRLLEAKKVALKAAGCPAK